MDNSPMNPYLTPAARPRTDALGYENAADRARLDAEWALECGNAAAAASSYRSAARSIMRASQLRAEAAALPGGTELDRRCVDWHRADADQYVADADRLAKP